MDKSDPSSGQMFTELIIKARRKKQSDGPRWYYSSRSAPSLKGHNTDIAPPTLETLAIRTMMRNLSSIEDGALQDLPLLLAHRCWDHVKRK